MAASRRVIAIVLPLHVKMHCETLQGRCHSVEATLPVGGGLIGEVHGWREWG